MQSFLFTHSTSLCVTIVTSHVYATQRSWFHNWINKRQVKNDICLKFVPAFLQTEHRNLCVTCDNIKVFYHELCVFWDYSYILWGVFWTEFGPVGQILVGEVREQHFTSSPLLRCSWVRHLSPCWPSVAPVLSGSHPPWAVNVLWLHKGLDVNRSCM